MPKINHEEYEVLKELDDKWKWIARDKDGEMYTFVIKPHKNDRFNDWRNHGCDWIRFENSLLQFIQWEDEEPHNIAELIEDYEEYKKASDYFKVNIKNVNQSMLDGLPKESEETEVKTLESIRAEIWVEMKRLEDDRKYRGSDVKYQTLREVLQKLGHLDEPEVLTPKWIEDNEFLVNDESGVDYTVVESRKLKGLLVQKQEEVDRAYKDGYEKGKQHATEKQSEETETVAGVLVNYLIASAKLKLALKMEVEELEE